MASGGGSVHCPTTGFTGIIYALIGLAALAGGAATALVGKVRSRRKAAREARAQRMFLSTHTGAYGSDQEG